MLKQNMKIFIEVNFDLSDLIRNLQEINKTTLEQITMTSKFHPMLNQEVGHIFPLDFTYADKTFCADPTMQFD